MYGDMEAGVGLDHEEAYRCVCVCVRACMRAKSTPKIGMVIAKLD